MTRLTVTIITRNEEDNLPRALASVAGLADEVLVVDSGSTDRTCDLARDAGARVLTRPWTDFSDQKNFAAAQASHDWILSLDADEELSTGLRDEMLRWKQSSPEVSAFSTPRRARYLGGWIRHSGWYPDRKVRLYRRDRARWQGKLHETLEVEGPVETLSGDLLHYTFRTLEEHYTQAHRYSTLAARLLFERGVRRWRFPLVAAPLWAFLQTFVLRLGFLDGTRGWTIARMRAYEVFLKFRKLGLLIRGGRLASDPGGSKL